MADSEAEEVELVEVIQTPQMGKKWPRLRTFFPSLARKGQYDPGDFQTTSQDDGAPKDHYHLVYIAMVMAGMGFLVPWTSYIGAIDYFFYYYQEEFPAVSVIIPIVYLVTTFLSCTLNLFLVRVVAIHSRIMFGYFMFITSLLMIPLLDIGIANCTIPTGVSFYITLFSIFLVGLASGGKTGYAGYRGLFSLRLSLFLYAPSILHLFFSPPPSPPLSFILHPSPFLLSSLLCIPPPPPHFLFSFALHLPFLPSPIQCNSPATTVCPASYQKDTRRR